MSRPYKAGLPLRVEMPAYRCPFCTKPIGYIGRAISAVFGARSHSCDFSNVLTPEEIIAELYPSLPHPQENRNDHA